MGNEEQKLYNEEQVSRLLGDLKRAEAPNDFDFGVRARIAKGKPADKSPSWLPVTVRYAVPLVLLVLVGGYFAFNAFYSLNVTSIPVVVADKPAKEPPIAGPPSTPVIAPPPDQTIAGHPDVKPETSTKGRLPAPERKVSPKAEIPGGGSIDLSQHEGVKIEVPKPEPRSRSTQISAKSVLTIIGVTVTSNEPVWKAVSVREGGIGDRSGIKAGDVIEAINDQPANEKTGFANRTILRTIRVRRDGTSIEIPISH